MSLQKLYTTAILCVISIAVVFLPNCGATKSGTKKSRIATEIRVAREQFDQLVARLTDLPVLPSAESGVDLSDARAQGSYQVAYWTTVSRPEIINFYLCEMERLGWRCDLSVHAHEDCLVFHKPTRRCVVSLRSSDDRVRVVMSLGRKY